MLVLYLRVAVVDKPLFLSGMPTFGSKGALVLAPETPKSRQTVATDAELNPKVTESAGSGAGAMA